MSEFFKAELKDRFLGYATDRDDYFEVQLLYDEFLRPNYSLEYTQKLVKEIVEYDPELLDVMSGNGTNFFMVSGTDSTEGFLEEGGFTDLFIKEEEKWDNFLEHLSYNIKATSKESALLGKPEKHRSRKEISMLAALIAGVALSFVFAFYSFVKSISSQENYVTKQELQNALNGLHAAPEENQESNESLSAHYQEKITDSMHIETPETNTAK
ncbi:hypothetical protein [Allomuricauda sp. d1]|uniref:hypothetical protein n=1 Tax=Allomuricauda sp. d1 TaxID=3136725 RepID=UPI0031CEBEBF